MQRNDEQIVEAVKNGQKEDFGILIDRYEKPLLAYAYRLTSSQEMIEDIVQESFIKAYRDLQGFNNKKKFSSWLYRIVHNTAIDYYRKSKNLVDIDALPELPESTDLASEIAEKLDKKVQKIALNKAIANLPIKYKEVIILRYFEEKDYDEIAEILNIPIGTLGTFINRAKSKLKLALKDLK